MWDFSGDELLTFILGSVITLASALLYYRNLTSIGLLGRSVTSRLILAVAPPLSLVPVYVALLFWADRQVAGHFDYMALFLLVGAALVFVSSQVFGFLGVSARDDALERNNPAAIVVVVASQVSVGLIYAGANVGGGPTIWTTLVPAVAGIVALFALRLAIEFIGGNVFETVTIDRDFSAGLRLAGAMVGCGVILGRAAGGEWASWPQTWTDFIRYGMPAIPLALAAGILHRVMRPSATVPRPNLYCCGLVPAVGFVAWGTGFFVHLNGLHPWEW